MRRLVLGTAGHIDHGKTALVRALTGTDADRLPDEKRRGITIDLGFATLPLPRGASLSIVDVPGHEAFIRNMVAGATGIDIVMLVVAADQGAMPQTHEHLAILDLLGISRGVIALTKCDLVDPEWLELVREDLREVLATTSLADAPIIDVSARTGTGLANLTAALDAAAADVPLRAHDDLFRMPIDRVFTVRGTGTVVTGTVWSGTLRTDAQVRVLPAGFTARVRGLQQHGIECEEVRAGARAAIALGGAVARDTLRRGDTVLTGAAWAPASMLTVHLTTVRDAGSPIRPRQRVRVHIGTAEIMARVALLDGGLAAGESAIVQLRLEEPLVARAGDHLVVRSYSPVRTIGGGAVLEPVPPKRKRLGPEVRDALMALAGSMAAGTAAATDSRARALARVDCAAMLAGPHGLEAALVPVFAGLTPQAADTAIDASDRVTRAGDRIVLAQMLAALEAAILAQAESFHTAEPMLDGIEREAARRLLNHPPLFDTAVAMLVARSQLVLLGNALTLPGHSAAPDASASGAMQRLATIYRDARLEPPDLADLPPDLAGRPDLPLLIRFLERDGTLLRLSATRLICARSVSETVASLRGQLPLGQALGIGDFRQVLKLTRKHLIPLLEHFDRTGVTRRSGETRVLTGSG